MGKIQSAVNQTLNLAAAAAVGHAKAEEQGLLAKEQYYEASASATELEAQAAEAENAVKKAAEKANKSESWNMTGKNAKMLEGKRNKLLSEKEAAERAFSELADKLEARKAMMNRAEKMMKRTGTWGGMK